MPSQRPYFLSSFIAAFRQQQGHSLQSTGQQPNKQASSSNPSGASYPQTPASASRTISTNGPSASSSSAVQTGRSQSTGVAIHSPRGPAGPTHTHGIPIPASNGSSASPPASSSRRRGSDSSSEGFRDVLGADKWYVGGKTATGEEKFFKLGVVRRVRSNDGLSLDRLSL